ncbi:hypothetical protein O181_010437 [Austropuccinia psidii MF-1]|uniref:Uncharacterized protein n=1 Tax=Austropuccinia psidii MF-1 TaxID=1389203 RepID=A0A9Q3BSM0_9BASI|nr:hypothetical protein [Austropuccinia psidii MF-1]
MKDLQVTQWMESIYGKEKHDAFNRRMEENNPTPPKRVPKTAPIARSSNFNMKMQPQAENKAKGKAPATNTYSQGYRFLKIQKDAMKNVFQMAGTMMELQKKQGSQIEISEIISETMDGSKSLYIAINDMQSNISDKNSSICNNIKTNNLSLSQINETIMCS